MSLLRWAIGTVLRRLRHQQGRTLQDVAAASGISIQYLSEVERGRKEASSEILAGICRALGVHLVDLLEEVRSELLRNARTRSAQGRSALRRNSGVRHPRTVRLVACYRPALTRTGSSTSS